MMRSRARIIVVVFGRDQREGVAGALGAAGATDAVDVGVGRIRHVEVDDVRNALHIEAARGDIGGDHDLMMPAPEALERRLALSLRTVAVQAGDLVTGALRSAAPAFARGIWCA